LHIGASGPRRGGHFVVDFQQMLEARVANIATTTAAIA
jgi:hypothetical protein